MCFTQESIDRRWEIRLSPPIRDRELGGIIPFSNLWLQDYEEYDGAQIVSLFFLAREASHYHRSRTQRNVRPLLRNPRSRPSHCPRAHARATSISPRREPLVGGRKSRAHYDRRAPHPCRPDTDAPDGARSRQETCHDRRTAFGKFWPSRPANHRARTPAPHFALAALQSSKRIRRPPPAHNRIRHTAADTKELRHYFMPHPLFGELDCYQWFIIAAGPSERHCNQCAAIKASADFPH